MSYQSALSAAETAEALYIKECGELGLATVVDTWMDQLPVSLKASTVLREKLIGVLDEQWSELEIAEAASVSVGGPSFEQWYGDQL